jgi:hypothetical protein
MEFFRAGAFHLLLAQEMAEMPAPLPADASEEDAMNYERQLDAAIGQRSQLTEVGFKYIIANSNMVATRLNANITHRCSFDGDPHISGLICTVDFDVPHSDMKSIVVGSLHVNNIAAKKRVVAHEAILRFLREAVKWDLDVVGVDYNQADKQLEQAMLEIFNGGVFFMPPLDGNECVACVVSPKSKIVKMDLRSKFYNVIAGDMCWQ